MCQVQGDFGASSPAGRAHPSQLLCHPHPGRASTGKSSSERAGEGQERLSRRTGTGTGLREALQGAAASWSQTPWPDCPGCSKSARGERQGGVKCACTVLLENPGAGRDQQTQKELFLLISLAWSFSSRLGTAVIALAPQSLPWHHNSIPLCPSKAAADPKSLLQLSTRALTPPEPGSSLLCAAVPPKIRGCVQCQLKPAPLKRARSASFFPREFGVGFLVLPMVFISIPEPGASQGTSR